MLDENLELNQDSDDDNLAKKLELDRRIALTIYETLKIIQNLLNAADCMEPTGHAEKEWPYRTIERKEVWVEKSDTNYKVVHSFSHKSKYDIYFIVYGYGKNTPPYVEINKDNSALFKAELVKEGLNFDIKIAKYDLKDELPKKILTHFLAFRKEKENHDNKAKRI